MSDENVWVIDDDQSIRWVLEKTLKQAGMQVNVFESADEALDALRSNALAPDALISDIRMPGSDGLALLNNFKQSHPNTPVLIMTAYSDLDSTVAAFEGGAFEYIPKPFDVDTVLEQVRRACHAHKEGAPAAGIANGTRNRATMEPEEPPELIGDAPAMQEVFKAIGRLSRSRITVLINGESGTGKELIAHALHRHSPRSDKPFVALNMAAIPHDLMESELFGHEKGSFTGAQSTRIGRFEQSDGGTLFLDEIGDMPATLQTRLLRVLADGQFYRVGGHVPITVNVRIIAATHQDLESLVEQKRFREDLFHRLNVIRIEAPPLRERREDIPSLLRHFLIKAASELGEEAKVMTPEFERHVSSLEWPGNVRQLQNTAHWLTVMANSNELSIDDLPEQINESKRKSGTDWENSFRQWVNRQLQEGEKNLLGDAQPAIERILIQCALNKTQDKRQEAAKLIGWGRNTLTRKIKELEIE
ncbi:MAG: nitrogen regulation protein NR(I) [Granulosicoccus sp.]|nr:nitrogen regulation protein NR(I) [Granulosicoccus sp.]